MQRWLGRLSGLGILEASDKLGRSSCFILVGHGVHTHVSAIRMCHECFHWTMFGICRLLILALTWAHHLRTSVALASLRCTNLTRKQFLSLVTKGDMVFRRAGWDIRQHVDLELGMPHLSFFR